jgi:hypothetical protein
LAISKQCQNNYMDAWMGIPATLHHDPSHHFLSPAPATGLLQRLRCCSSRLKSSVCDFFLLTLHWFLASSMETPSVIETEWYQLEVKCFDSEKKTVSQPRGFREFRCTKRRTSLNSVRRETTRVSWGTEPLTFGGFQGIQT